nr:unnamed protein product [Digitaria exilis]
MVSNSFRAYIAAQGPAVSVFLPPGQRSLTELTMDMYEQANVGAPWSLSGRVTPCPVGSRASILGLGVAVPEHFWVQDSFPDYYFGITNSNHLVDLKGKFQNICKKTMIEKRHMHMSDDLLKHNPCITAYKSHGCIPDADFEVLKLLGLPLSTRSFMLYQASCHGGGMALRLAKDLAENNPGARVLVVCSEVITMALRGPSETHVGNLVGQAIFSDARKCGHRRS